MPKLRWEKKSDRVYVAFTSCVREDMRGKRFQSAEAVRVIKEPDGRWRADRTSAVAGAWMPWEPATRESYRDARTAKEGALQYVKRCQQKSVRSHYRSGDEDV